MIMIHMGDTRAHQAGRDAQWSKRGGHDAINSNDSFMQSKWYQIDGLIKDNLNLAKFLLNFGGKFEFLARICTISVECPL